MAEGGLDALSFDMAVAMVAMRAPQAEGTPPAAAPQPVAVNPDPIAFFRKVGLKGWNNAGN